MADMDIKVVCGDRERVAIYECVCVWGGRRQ